MFALLSALLICAGRSSAPDTVVVCAPVLRDALAPWVEHRTGQGHRLVLVNTGTSSQIAEAIGRVAEQGNLRAIVLVGDARPDVDEDVGQWRRCVPTWYKPARVNVQWGSEPEIATDVPYADLDHDGRPDVAIGRLSVDTPVELARVVEKIIEYERNADFGRWRRRVALVAGVGGMGRIIDAAVERAARGLITSGVPASYRTTMTYANWRSPYCPHPRRFQDYMVHGLNEGCLYWVYIGHGHYRALDPVRVPGREYELMSTRDVQSLKCQQRMPIALFLSCYSGAFDADHDCLAEAMLKTDGAPVAAICGTRVTMPYGMAVLATELLHQCFQVHSKTLGETLLEASVRTHDASTDPQRAFLDLLASTLGPTTGDLAEERAEHVHMFHLIGDPLLRIHHPSTVRLEVQSTVQAGAELDIVGDSDVDGRAWVELVVPHGQLTFRRPDRRDYHAIAVSETAVNEIYRRANDPCLAASTCSAIDGRFMTTIRVPPPLDGDCHVRVFVEGETGFSVGTAKVVVVPQAGATEIASGQKSRVK